MIINKQANISFLEFTDYLRERFPFFKVQKISLNAGFTCPNRDGTRGRGGCTYCNNATFHPAYCCESKSITRQLREGIDFFSRKYPSMKYLAYFQAYTNTYDKLEVLKSKYEEALNYENVVGIIISTRPDCVSDELLDYLQSLAGNAFVMIEYGVESTSNETLQRINRGHTWEETVNAIRRTTERAIPVGAHLILGLPGETREQMLQHATRLSGLPITSIKLHQLQIIRDTVMAIEYEKRPDNFPLFASVDEYIHFILDFLGHLRTDIYIDRLTSQSPENLLIAPHWGIKNHEFKTKLTQAPHPHVLFCKQIHQKNATTNDRN